MPFTSGTPSEPCTAFSGNSWLSVVSDWQWHTPWFSGGSVVAGVAATVFAVYLGRAPTITLNDLEPGQELGVHVRSRGCFHAVERTFAFVRRPDGSLARVMDGIERPLRDDEVEAIDKELDYARTVRDTGCTTVLPFALTLTDHGRLLAKALFSDESCGSDYQMLVGFTYQKSGASRASFRNDQVVGADMIAPAFQASMVAPPTAYWIQVKRATIPKPPRLACCR